MASPWSADDIKLKGYPHFDKAISREDAFSLATSPARVASHTFYPFFRFSQGWTKFTKKGVKSERKDRELRFAARADAYIFSRYRHLLAERYEEKIQAAGLSDNILAYRRIIDQETGRGKSNIEFARDAFNSISELRQCFVIALDISKFFESIDHSILRSIWLRMIEEDRLPVDHQAVYEAITKYAVVDKQEVLERIGHFGPKGLDARGLPKKGYLTPYKKMPTQLCTGAEFRQKIAGGDGTRSLIRKNQKPYGIPQGAPISDILANMYLFDFDLYMLNLAKSMSGRYYRYSDDILLIIDTDDAGARAVAASIRESIKKYGKKLLIKESKSSILEFSPLSDRQTFRLLDSKPGVQGRNGLEYLGFRFDGRKVYIRDKTISNLWRKVVKAARRHAIATVRRYPGKTLVELRRLANYDSALEKFGRVDEFASKQDEYRKWTFWTYARRASERFGDKGSPIILQIRAYKKIVRKKCESALIDVYEKSKR